MKILGEQNLRIKQNLMALDGQTMDDIKEIRSHPIALAQCMAFLNEHPGIHSDRNRRYGGKRKGDQQPQTGLKVLQQ
jgi:prephenate dehydratase